MTGSHHSHIISIIWVVERNLSISRRLVEDADSLMTNGKLTIHSLALSEILTSNLSATLYAPIFTFNKP